jgi:hypothetical protein
MTILRALQRCVGTILEDIETCNSIFAVWLAVRPLFDMWRCFHAIMAAAGDLKEVIMHRTPVPLQAAAQVKHRRSSCLNIEKSATAFTSQGVSMKLKQGKMHGSACNLLHAA